MANQYTHDSDVHPEAIGRAARRGGTGGDCLVEYCIRNVEPGDRRRLDALDVDVSERFCLQRCGDCDAEPFLVIDGRYVAGGHRALADALAAEVDSP